MQKIIIAGLATASLIAVAGCKPAMTAGNEANASANASATAAGGSIDGTWKTDLSTLQIDTKPDQLLLKDGVDRIARRIVDEIHEADAPRRPGRLEARGGLLRAAGGDQDGGGRESEMPNGTPCHGVRNIIHWRPPQVV